MTPNSPDRNELDRLLYRWCEGDITDVEGQQLERLLAEDSEARKYFLDYLQLDAHLSWELPDEEAEPALALPSGLMVDGARNARPRRRTLLLAGSVASALAVLLLAGYWTFRPERGREAVSPMPTLVSAATVQAVTGVVEIVGSDGAARPGAAGDMIRAGESIRTGAEDSTALVQHDRGARIELGPDTEVLLARESEAGQHADLVQTRGAVVLDVASQPADRPLVVETPHSTIRVVGTQFCSFVGVQATRVETEEGRVEVTRSSDHQTAVVGEGDYVLIGASKEPLSVRAAPITLTEPTRTLEDPESNEHIRAICFKHDGTTLVTGGAQGSLRFWDTPSGQVRKRISAHRTHVRGVVLSPDGQTFATAGEDNRVRFWDAETAEARSQEIVRPNYAWPLVFCEQGRLVVTASAQGAQPILRFWQSDTGQTAGQLPVDLRLPVCLAIAPDGRTLAGGGSEGNVFVCDLHERKQTRALRAHEKTVQAMAFSPDGRWLATGGKDALVMLWDTADWHLRATLEGHTRPVVSLAFCPDRQLLATSDNAGITRVWDVRTGREEVIISWPRYREARTVFTPDGRSVVTAGTQSTIKFWDLSDDVRESSAAWQIKP